MMNCFDNFLKMKSDIEDAIMDSVLKLEKKDGNLYICIDHDKFNDALDCIYAEYIEDAEDTSAMNDDVWNCAVENAMMWYEGKAKFLMGMED